MIAASGTLAQIIPPSLVLIIMADQLGRRVGDMYAGAFIPGFVLTGAVRRATCSASRIVKPHMGAGAAAGGAHDPRAGRHAAALRSLRRARDRLSVVAAVAFAKLRTTAPDAPTDELIVVVDVRRRRRRLLRSRSSTTCCKLGLLSRIAERVTFVLIPPLALIFLVLGTIFLGVATPTEGGAMGATGALIMALARRRLSI